MTDFFEKIIPHPVLQIDRLSGGDINEVFAVKHAAGECVVKMNDASRFPQMLELEAMGLRTLASANTVKIPTVLGNGILDDKQYLLLEKIETGNASPNTWKILGAQLAKLHQHTQKQFGFDSHNYIGSLIQQNQGCNSWTEFLITQRLQPMLEMAINQGDVNYVEAKIFDGFFKRINELFPLEKPALLHGDLWSGNCLIDASQSPVLIDPAVYYGHREMDIAMMHLFGGFSPTTVQHYNEIYPLEKGWEKRLELHQLYPLLVHVNLFGRSYWERVRRIVEPFA